MRSAIAALRRRYGAHPLHLLGLLACFALLGYVIDLLGPAALWNKAVWWQSIVVWFLGAIILHDLLLFPLYALADRAVHGVSRALARARATNQLPVDIRNHIRIPALAAGLLFLLFLPGIIEQGRVTYRAATGQTQQPYLARWLWITAALLALSALVYALRVRRATAAARAARRAARRLAHTREVSASG
ncbi:MAG: hypothetical protein ACRDRN_20755, partial [Sciscionella sp.]